ncbi:MAG: 5-carboxymethyl-2-hydroxymuconate isomerase [Gammaproteobacteria bacterium]|nr:5-carboxymethyl-2-hydroxymuconate isomerase [Gammaproteobacteria bacterium]
MPHLIIEFSHELATDERVGSMMEAVLLAAQLTGLFEQNHIKVRMIPIQYYRTIKGRDAFIHAQLRIHSGRNAQQKKLLSEAVLASIREQHWPVKQITVEVVDMDRDSYSKYTAI